MGMAAVEAQFHVLAVDDSLIDRKLIERLLKTSSYQVTTVDSGSKALEVLGWHEDEAFDSPKIHQELEVNLVITDYCMPGMTGYDLLKKIKESSLLRDIPVVIMSSENVPSRINRCLEEGAEEFFLKPVRLSDVNKLKPHMMKAKSKDIQKPEKPENDDSAEDENDDSAEEEEEKQENDDSAEEEEEENDDSAGEEEEETEQQIVQSNNNNNNNNNINNNNNNKRKSIDDGLSPDRSRPNRTRYSNGLTVMSN